MTLERLDPCCQCEDHQRPYRNEDGWVLTGDPNDFDTLQAWFPAEWKRHCDRYADTSKARRAETARTRYHRKKRAA